MEIYYQDKIINQHVIPRSCLARDAVGERSDSLEIEFENAAGWYPWGAKEDDKIRVTESGYDTGTMYLNTITAEDGYFRLLASSLPCKARGKQTRSFTKKNVLEIMQICSMANGMGFQSYGIDGNAVIPYLQQEDEGSAAFLLRLLRMEGAALKCVNGKFTAIGLLWAQGRAVHQTITLKAWQPGVDYERSGESLRSLTVKSPYASASATDSSVPSSHSSATIMNYPAKNATLAGRWARGTLLDRNRKCETLTMRTMLNIGFSAMTRIDIDGGTDADGEWLIEEATHDFINRSSTAIMHRCIKTIR